MKKSGRTRGVRYRAAHTARFQSLKRAPTRLRSDVPRAGLCGQASERGLKILKASKRSVLRDFIDAPRQSVNRTILQLRSDVWALHSREEHLPENLVKVGIHVKGRTPARPGGHSFFSEKRWRRKNNMGTPHEHHEHTTTTAITTRNTTTNTPNTPHTITGTTLPAHPPMKNRGHKRCGETAAPGG